MSPITTRKYSGWHDKARTWIKEVYDMFFHALWKYLQANRHFRRFCILVSLYIVFWQMKPRLNLARILFLTLYEKTEALKLLIRKTKHVITNYLSNSIFLANSLLKPSSYFYKASRLNRTNLINCRAKYSCLHLYAICSLWNLTSFIYICFHFLWRQLQFFWISTSSFIRAFWHLLSLTIYSNNNCYIIKLSPTVCF